MRPRANVRRGPDPSNKMELRWDRPPFKAPRAIRSRQITHEALPLFRHALQIQARRQEWQRAWAMGRSQWPCRARTTAAGLTRAASRLALSPLQRLDSKPASRERVELSRPTFVASAPDPPVETRSAALPPGIEPGRCRLEGGALSHQREHHIRRRATGSNRAIAGLQPAPHTSAARQGANGGNRTRIEKLGRFSPYQSASFAESGH